MDNLMTIDREYFDELIERLKGVQLDVETGYDDWSFNLEDGPYLDLYEHPYSGSSNSNNLQVIIDELTEIKNKDWQKQKANNTYKN